MTSLLKFWSFKFSGNLFETSWIETRNDYGCISRGQQLTITKMLLLLIAHGCGNFPLYPLAISKTEKTSLWCWYKIVHRWRGISGTYMQRQTIAMKTESPWGYDIAKIKYGGSNWTHPFLKIMIIRKLFTLLSERVDIDTNDTPTCQTLATWILIPSPAAIGRGLAYFTDT